MPRAIWFVMALSLAACSSDADGDGHAPDVDCDDEDPLVHPGAVEVCDGIDNDCDGGVDDDAVDRTVSYADIDGDTFGDAASSAVTCTVEAGRVTVAGDCDDGDDGVHPGALEACDDADRDCDGDPVAGAVDASPWFADGDDDGFGDPAAWVVACVAPQDHVATAGDCDDGAAGVHPLADEHCDAVDWNCDGDPELGAVEAVLWFEDGDGDDFGDPTAWVVACTAPIDHVADATDCDDGEVGVHPLADEHCDETDWNCDGDPHLDAVEQVPWYADADADGFGDAGVTALACAVPAGFVAAAGDCDDHNDTMNPGLPEICNDQDDDCDAQTGERDAIDVLTVYRDLDEDGYGNPNVSDPRCEVGLGWLLDDSDCDDTLASVHPLAPEYCNAIDDDCDTAVDEGHAVDAPTWYIDVDGDGRGSDAYTLAVCNQIAGWVPTSDDCDDGDATISPRELEACNGVDDDCDEAVDEAVCGPVQLPWLVHAGTNYHVTPEDHVVLADESVVVAGYFAGTATFGPGEPGETVLSSQDGGEDIFLARFTPQGQLSWATRHGGDWADWAIAIADAGDDAFVVTGVFARTAVFGPDEPTPVVLGTGNPDDYDYDVFVARFATDGSVQWVQRAGVEGVDREDTYGDDVAAFPDGSVVVVGRGGGATTFAAGTAEEATLAPQGGADGFVARYAADGTLQWVNGLGTALPDRAGVVGAAADGTTLVGTQEGSTNQELHAVTAFDAQGAAQWTVPLGTGPADRASVYDLQALDDGGFVASGNVVGTVVFGAGEGAQTTLPESADIWVAAWAQDGTLDWVSWAGDPGGANVPSLSVCPGGRVTLTGLLTGDVDFDGLVLSSAFPTGTADGFVAIYEADGAFVDGYVFTANDDDLRVAASRCLADGSVVVSGRMDDDHTEFHLGGDPWVFDPTSGDWQAWLARFAP